MSKAASAGMTQSEVRSLDPAQRIGELARMLGGVEVGDEARAAAKKLLADALQERPFGRDHVPRDISVAPERALRREVATSVAPANDRARTGAPTLLRTYSTSE